MTKGKKLAPYPKYRKLSFKVKETTLTTQPKNMPINIAEEKKKFIQTGGIPQFKLQDPPKIKEGAEKAKYQIRFHLQGEAVHILEHVLNEFGDGESYLGEAFGPRIDKDEATPLLLEYITENSLSESLTIHWCDNLNCSAKMMWKGPMVNCNRPDLRKYSLWINGSDDNNYMRESGIRCLMDHEIGTHFFRMLNDGFQPWFSDRAKFGLRPSRSFESKCSEEGLATINTVLRGRVKLLWGAAFAYYTACKSVEMTFKELFDHIGRYTSNKHYRWKQVMRVKRGLVNPNDLGGCGNDQCYFEGAVNILRNMEKIDFCHLMSGKVCYDEVDRIKRVVRKECLRFPFFMHKMASYKKTLRKICSLNGLDKTYSVSNPVIADVNCLDKCKTCSLGDNKKVRSKSEAVKIRPKKLNSKNVTSAEKNDQPINNDKDDETVDVESFKISSYFINWLQCQEEVARREKQTCQIYERFETVTNELAILDSTIEQKILNLRNIVKEHNWSNNDAEYKQNLLNQVTCELNIDISLVSEEELCPDLALEDAISTQINRQQTQPKTTLMKSPRTMTSRLKHKKLKSLKFSKKLDCNTNSSCPGRYFKRKQQKLISLPEKTENNHPPKSKRKKKAEELTEKAINEKVTNMKAQFLSDIKPYEIIYLEMSDSETDLSSSEETASICGLTIDISDDITTVLPQINGDANSGALINATVGSSNAEQQNNAKSYKSKQQAGSRQVPNFILRNKLLARRSSVNSDNLQKRDGYTDKGSGSDTDSDSDDCKSKCPNINKNNYAHIVSHYAQFKPRLVPKVKSDREMLAADMCQPFFIQAERLLQAEKVLRKTKSGCRK